jgi:hypothetical protein
VLVLQVSISTDGGMVSTGTMTISSTGSNAGVTLAIAGGSAFSPIGIGTVSITTGGGERGRSIDN